MRNRCNIFCYGVLCMFGVNVLGYDILNVLVLIFMWCYYDKYSDILFFGRLKFFIMICLRKYVISFDNKIIWNWIFLKLFVKLFNIEK